MALTQISTKGIKDGTIIGSDLATNIDLVNNQKLRLGTNNALQIYHDGTDSYVQNATGDLYIQTTGSGDDIFLSAIDNVQINVAGKTGVVVEGDGAVDLYHNGNKKFETYQYGVNFSGTAKIESGGNFYAHDNVKFIAGTSEDLQIYHDGSNSYLEDAGTGDLIAKVSASNFRIRGAGNAEIAKFGDDGSVDLYYNGNKKFETTSSGVAITGEAALTGGTLKLDSHPLVSIASFTDISGGSYAARLGSTGTSTIRSTQIYGGGGHIATFDGVNKRLGIGTTSPSDNIHLAESGATNNYIRFSNSNVSDGWSVGAQSGGRFQIVQNGVADRLVVTTAGKVNIGNTQMSQNLLNIEDDTAAAIDIASHGTGGDTAYIGVKKSTGGGLTLGISNRDIIFKTGATYSSGTTFDSGTERLRISSGNVRIGINDNEPAQLELRYSTVPTYLTSTFDGTVGEATLSVNVPRTSDGSGSWGSHSNTGYGSSAIQVLSHSSTGGYVSILTGNADNTNPTEKLRVDANGDTEINSANDKGLFVKTNGNNASIRIRATGSTDGGGFRMNHNAPTSTLAFGRVDSVGAFVSTLLTLESSGNLTFGKSVYGEQDSENFYRIKFFDTGGIANDVGIGQPDSSSLGFNVVSNGTIRFYRGTANEHTRFTENGELRVQHADQSETSTSTDHVHAIGSPSLNTVTTNLARLVMQERVSNWIAFKDGSGTHYGTIAKSGSFVVYGGQSSDYRIKENVVNVSNGITLLKQLRPVNFNYTSDSGFTAEEQAKVHIGFIAHEFAEICPTGVIGEKDGMDIWGDCTNSEGKTTQTHVPESKKKEGETWTEKSRTPDYQQIDFSKAVPVLTAALQEAISKIELLETEVATLKAS